MVLMSIACHAGVRQTIDFQGTRSYRITVQWLEITRVVVTSSFNIGPITSMILL